jgi:hypothetical protein
LEIFELNKTGQKQIGERQRFAANWVLVSSMKFGKTGIYEVAE